MKDVQIGDLVRSKKGRDQEKIYMVYGLEGERAVLVDGKIRTIKRPKLKNVKHVKPILKECLTDPKNLSDEEIARCISTFEQTDS